LKEKTSATNTLGNLWRGWAEEEYSLRKSRNVFSLAQAFRPGWAEEKYSLRKSGNVFSPAQAFRPGWAEEKY
jgi:hypothetical protein